MDTGINIGPTVDDESIEATAESIIDILEAGAELNTDEETLRHAITKLSSSIDANVTVEGARIVGSVVEDTGQAVKSKKGTVNEY